MGLIHPETTSPASISTTSRTAPSLAQLLHGNRIAVESSVFGRVVTLGDATEKRTCLSASFFWRPDAVQANRETPGSAFGSVLNQVTALAGCENPKPKPWQLVIPKEVIGISGPGKIDGTLGQFGHFSIAAAVRSALPRKRSGSSGMEIAAYFRASTSARNTDKLCSFNMMACYGEAFRRIAKSKKCAPKAKVRGSNPLGRAINSMTYV